VDWRELISDFNGLVTEIVQRNSRNKVAKLLSHDPKTINSWLQGGEPSDPGDVAEVIRQALLSGIDLSRFQSYAPIYDLSPSLNYEQTVKNPPPDLDWLTSARRAPEVKTQFCGIELDCPLGVASSPLVADDRWAELVLNLGFGLSTLKTKRATHKEAWPPPFIAFVLEPPDLSHYDATNPQQVLVSLNRNEIRDSIPSLVNSIGVPSEVPTIWQDMYERIKRHPRGRLMGISVMADGSSGIDLAKDIELAIDKAKEVNPTFIELNLTCPNLENGVDFCDDISLIGRITKRARTTLRSTGTPLVLKLPGFSAPSSLENILKEAGKNIDAVAFRNTTRVRPVSKDRDGRLHSPFPGREFGGLSGPCTFETTRRGVHNLVTIKARLGLEFSIVAVGGVATFGNAIELLDAGADVVQACTGPIFDPLLAWKVRYYMHQFMRRVGLEAATALFLPRNQAEHDSFKNALEAYSQIQRRYPARAVPLAVFQQKWNDWIEQRPSAAIGKAHRMPAPRTFEEWIRDFTS
jgi:dihydroorotate dehydrogenase